jgi:hypothetical protein
MTEKRTREKLIAKRNLLFQWFLYNPKEIHLAIEIKALDDQIAEITQRMVEKEMQNREKSKSAESRKRSA